MLSTTPPNVASRPLDRTPAAKGPRPVATEPAPANGRPADGEPRLPQDRVTLSPEALRGRREPGARDGRDPVEQVAPHGAGDAGELAGAPRVRRPENDALPRPVREPDEERDEAEAVAPGAGREARRARASDDSGAVDPDGGGDAEAEGGPGDELTPEERAQVAELQARDGEVRAHEAAHQGAGGGLAGAASFTFQVGPDGRSYAVGGEVPIRIQSGRTPEETIRNAQKVRAAALAPAEPSAADLSVAATASELEAAARLELAKKAAETYRATASANDGGRESTFAIAA
jgi:hypothetical protein